MIPTQQSDSVRLITPTMLVLFLVLATVPLWIARAGLYPYLGIEILIWSLYALAFNLVLGTAGLPSFGHGAYFGIGAYAFGLCQFNVVANLWICLAAAFVIAGLAGALVALFISHRRGIYYAFMTIAFGQIFWTLAIKSHKVTGGEDGLLKIARLPADLGFASFDLAGNVAFYYFVLIVFGVAVIALWRLVHSPYGRVIAAIKQSETRAAHLGYNVWLYKASIFTLSAAVSGFAGGLFAMAQLAAFPDVMSLHQSGYVVMMTLVGGGLVSFWGPVVGVFLFLIARDVIGAHDQRLDAVFRLAVHRRRAVPARGRCRRHYGSLAKPFAAFDAAAGRLRAASLVRRRTMALIDVAGIHVRFGDRVVLESIDLAVPEGEFHGLMGPNGAGKTTFFNVLTGRVKPSRGSIRLDGEDVTGLSSHRIAAKGVARSFQIMTLFDEFTARENVMVGLPGFRARGFDMRHAAAGDHGFATKASEVLATVGLSDKGDVRAKDLSYGDRRALEIAVALGQNPRVLCLDEPTSGLGSDGVQRLAALVGRLKGKLTIVAIEHDMEFLFSLADRISVIHWGQVVARGTPHELQQNEWVKRSNLGRFA